jgi:2-iminoacetate synthase
MKKTSEKRHLERAQAICLPDWLDPAPWLDAAQTTQSARVEAALASESPDITDFAALISPAAQPYLERMARRAQHLTRRHFGNTISLYVPLYLADHCSSGCSYCGFASDRERPRVKLGDEEIRRELATLKSMGFDETLLLTGDRHREADFNYLRHAVDLAADDMDLVAVETFTLKEEEYADLSRAGCSSVTLYQETYNPLVYFPTHRWGPKYDFMRRLAGPAAALAGGIRTIGLGVLLGLAPPVPDILSLFRHTTHLRKTYWKSGVAVSFPRIRPQLGDYAPAHPVGDSFLAQIIFAFRICLPDVPLVLSTRESARFRDGIAGVGISKMSIASRTTVGGYAENQDPHGGQFEISDERPVDAFCDALRAKGLEPVFKNWDAVYTDREERCDEAAQVARRVDA